MDTTSGTIPPNGSAGAMQGNGSGTRTASVHSAIDEAARKAGPAIDRAASMAHDAADRMSAVGTQTADWVSAQTEQLSAAQKKLVDDTCAYVAANPLKSLAMALAAGYVISRILK